MTARDDERKERWTRLLDQIFNPIVTFEADYDDRRPKPEDGMVLGRRLHQIYRSERGNDDDAEARKALGLYLYNKRIRWCMLWNDADDRITECESEHVRSAPAEAAWAASAAKHVRRRLIHFLRELQIKHPDMPDMVEWNDSLVRWNKNDPAYRWVMSQVDSLESLYVDIYEVDNNYIDRAPDESERKRRIAARERTREWIDFRASGGVDVLIYE
jgi:hypothetical protein